MSIIKFFCAWLFWVITGLGMLAVMVAGCDPTNYIAKAGQKRLDWFGY